MTYSQSLERSAITVRAVEFIRKNFGSLRDLPKPLISVVWVSIYRTTEIAMRVEASGGSTALLKDALIGDEQLNLKFEEAVLQVEFLQKMIPTIRANKSPTERLSDSQLAIDILKWGIDDAVDISWLKRFVLRKFRKADPLYKRPFPPEIA